ncbi:MAG TPA: colicin V production protein [Bacteroidales bacterium]|jgi:membrane protein required for colicin V production|nr:colicin V production protein [Bacteroidales bacterium]
MSILDIILLAFFIYAGFKGFRKGFIRQAAGLVGLIIGIWGAIRFSEFTAGLLTEHFSITTKYLPLIAFAITFAALVIAIHFIGVLLEGIGNLVFLGLVNKLLGTLFGILKTALIFSVILLLISKVSDRVKIIPDDFGQDSILYNPIKKIAPSIYPYLKFDEIKGTLEDTFTQDKDNIEI